MSASSEVTRDVTEQPEQRSGDNLYPVTFTQQFGDLEMTLDVPRGVWNPTPHGVHLADMLLRLDFAGEHVLELGTGCGICKIVSTVLSSTTTSIWPIHTAGPATASCSANRQVKHKSKNRRPVQGQVESPALVYAAEPPFLAVEIQESPERPK